MTMENFSNKSGQFTQTKLALADVIVTDMTKIYITFLKFLKRIMVTATHFVLKLIRLKRCF